MTLGELIDELKAMPQNLVVEHGFAHPHSYRGSYDCLAFEPETDITVAAMLDAALGANGQTFDGYKGGVYRMDRHTDVYVARHGEMGDPITDATLRAMLIESDFKTLLTDRDSLRAQLRRLEADLAWVTAERDSLRRENENLRNGTIIATEDRILAAQGKELNRDRTGLAHSLQEIVKRAGGSSWLAESDNWGSYEAEQRTEEALRSEIGSALDDIEKLANVALIKSGGRAVSGFRAVVGRDPEPEELCGYFGGCMHGAALSSVLNACGVDTYDEALARIASLQRDAEAMAEAIDAFQSGHPASWSCSNAGSDVWDIEDENGCLVCELEGYEDTEGSARAIVEAVNRGAEIARRILAARGKGEGSDG